MPVSPITPLSLKASINLQNLREAFSDLRDNHDFHVDAGAWCCKTCAGSDAWSEGADKPFVFWHEQNEDQLHEDPTLVMPLCFGLAKKGASDEEVSKAARKIIAVLSEHDFRCDWEDEDIKDNIMVHLDTQEPVVDDDEDHEENDYMDVALYIPENKDTKGYCMNPSEEEEEPEDSFMFYQRMNDGESLKDAVLRLPLKVRRHITHYQRMINTGCCGSAVEPIFEIDQAGGHAGCGESLLDALEAEEDDE
jgi:hypothetical protein